MSTFSKLGLSKPVLDVLHQLEFTTPTPIQEQAIPILLDGLHDFIGLAQTGTGKTLAFGLPIIERIDPDTPHTQALVLAPTRELGQQIAEQLKMFSKNTNINILAVYGGANINTQLKTLKKPQHILIATPGRLLDLLKRKAVKLQYIEYLVLDEADEMLNMGFKEDLDKILEYSSENKLTWLFSATMSKDIRKIVEKYMYAPIEVKLAPKDTLNKNISHFYASISPRNKAEAIARIIDANSDIRMVVFCRTKRETQELSDKLQQQKYAVDCLHGDLSQAQRDVVMKKFKNHRLQTLIATDIAARGIDVQDITHVIHHNLPDETESYTHRSGRTARAGKEGISIAFVSNRDYHKFQQIQKQLKIDFKEYIIPDYDEILEAKIQQWSQKIIQENYTDNKIDEIYNSIKDNFKDIDKHQLIKNLLELELENLAPNTKKLNEKLQAPSKSNHKGGRGRGRKRNNRNSYKKKNTGNKDKFRKGKRRDRR